MDLQVPFQVIMDHCVPRGRRTLVPLGLCTGRGWTIEALEIPAVSHGVQFAFKEAAERLTMILHFGCAVTDVVSRSLAYHVTEPLAATQA